MTTSANPRVGELVRWAARLWSIPLIAVTFLLAAGPLNPLPFKNTGNLFVGGLSSFDAMAFAVAFVIAWRYESVGSWIALVSAVAFKALFTVRSGHLPFGLFDLVLLPPAILFLVSSFLHGGAGNAHAQEPTPGHEPELPSPRRRFFALPRTALGWWSLIIGTGFFVFMRLFWMQAFSPGRDRSKFFSDPLNAACLIGAFASPILGMLLALLAIIWKHERSLLLVPLLLFGVFALVWAIAVLSGANA